MKKLSETYKELGINFSFPIVVKDEKGRVTYCERSNCFWSRYEYDENNKETYCESSNGYWSRIEYDEYNNETYCENSNGFWSRYEYDEDGNETYYETSNGYIEGTKRGSCDVKVIKIDGNKYKLTEL